MRLPSLITLMPSVRNLAVACLLLAVAPAGHGATCTWNGGSGDWHDAAKWSCGTVPTAADDVMLVTDPVSGITYEFCIYKQKRQLRYEVNLCWGAKVIAPRHCGLLIGA